METSHIPKVYFHPAVLGWAGLGWAGRQVCGQQGAGRRDQFPAKDTAKLGAKGGQHGAPGPSWRHSPSLPHTRQCPDIITSQYIVSISDIESS